MCDAKDLDIQRLRSWSVDIDSMGPIVVCMGQYPCGAWEGSDASVHFCSMRP